MLYRDHKGSLAESLETQIEVTCKQDVIDHLNKFYAHFGQEVTDLFVEFYTYDQRIKWNTHIVSFTLTGDEKGLHVAGFTNGMLE
jgi:hypothetical protein